MSERICNNCKHWSALKGWSDNKDGRCPVIQGYSTSDYSCDKWEGIKVKATDSHTATVDLNHLIDEFKDVCVKYGMGQKEFEVIHYEYEALTAELGKIKEAIIGVRAKINRAADIADSVQFKDLKFPEYSELRKEIYEVQEMLEK